MSHDLYKKRKKFEKELRYKENHHHERDNRHYRQIIQSEVDMHNERKINPKNYIGDIDMEEKTHDNDDIRIRISILEEKIEKIYRALNSSNIIKATPIVSLVYSDKKKCHDYVSMIYEKWINYLCNTSRANKGGLSIIDLYRNLDSYIFKDSIGEYAKRNNLEVKIIPIPFVEKNETENINKEYVSMTIENNEIIIKYSPNQLSRACNNDDDEKENNTNDHQRIQPDIQMGGNSRSECLAMNNSVVDQIENKAIYVNISDKSKLIKNADKRFIILGSERPLFNTTVFTSTLKNLNSTLHNVGEPLLNFSIVIFHAMLHFKCFMETNDYSYNHDINFIQELINFTPSAIFGHPLLPPVSISF